MNKKTDDLRIKQLRSLIPPAVLLEELPLSLDTAEVVTAARMAASKIVQGRDDRLLVIVGPCSVHDPKAALDYAQKLKVEAEALKNELLIVMRVYFEKPRTTIGWKGLINDPKLNGSFQINHGLRLARQLLLDINELGLPCSSEFLDVIIPQYISDLIAWGAIGARTTESQIHRELASGLSMPIGFKNGTTGNVQIAVDAASAAQHSHHFLGITKQGIAAIMHTSGNNAAHIILRGSSEGTNFDAQSIAAAAKLLKAAKLPQRIMVDCSHGNSSKDHKRQATVAEALCEQISIGSKTICGVMLESNLVEGKQALQEGVALNYGQSVTDACISWNETKPLLQKLAAAVKNRRKK